MPGRLFLDRPADALMAELGVTVGGAGLAGPRPNIVPGQEVLCVVADEPGAMRLCAMRWGMIPVGRKNARGRPVMDTIVNARGETVFGKSAFAGTGRALVPVDGWYEWTGRRGRKTAWRIAPRDGAVLTFAAITDIWTAPGGTRIDQVATVTCPPSADVAAVHDRMGVIVAPADRLTWLTGGRAEADALIRPWPAGRLSVTRAEGVDLSGR